MMRCETCPLHQAAAANDTMEIWKLLLEANDTSKKFMLNAARNERGQTPLHAAVESHSYEAMLMLIKEGCDVNGQDDRGNTVHHIAVRRRFYKIEAYLVNLNGENRVMDVQNEDGDTAYHLYVTSWGFDKRHTKFLSINVFNREGYSPFHLAIKLDKLDAVQILLEEKPNLANQLSGNGEPPLWVALKHGHVDTMKMLLEKGCDVNQKNTKIGAPTIWLAVYRQDKKAIELLLGSPEFNNTTITAPSLDGSSPLLLAMIKGHLKQVDQLIRVSASQDMWNALAQKVLFALATKVDFKKIRDDPSMLSIVDRQGNTLLHLAVQSDSLKMVKGILTAGSRKIEHVIDMAYERECPHILDYLTEIHQIPAKKIHTSTYSVAKEFPRFSDNFEELFYQLKEANKPWFVVEPNKLGQIPYDDLKKHVIPKVNIEWSDIKKCKGGGISIFPPLSQMKNQITVDDDHNTAMVKDFLSILIHIETYLREDDDVFKHLDVVLLPVGSTVEGTKVGRLNELDVMLFCTKLHGFLSVKDEQSICLSKDGYNDLPMIIRDLFDLNMRTLNIAKFFALFMQSIKKAIRGLVAKCKIPKSVELFLNASKCTEPDCKANTGEEWSQCHHMEPPCVCYTAVGTGLNFVWKGKENKNMMFTIDIVPNFYVDLDGNSNFTLRQKLIKHLMDQKPAGWSTFLKKYISDDRIYMGQFDLEQKRIASVGIKMINTRGDFVIRPGLNMHAQDMLKNKLVHETYCFLKVLKALTSSKVKSFDLKKAISDQLRGSRMEKPRDVFAFAKQVLSSPDLRGKFDGLCQPLAEHYQQVDLLDFPAKNSLVLAIHLMGKEALELLNHIITGNLKGFKQLFHTMSRPALKNMLVNGRSLLHYAAEGFRMDIVLDLLLARCDVNLQDLHGDTALHCMILYSRKILESNQIQPAQLEDAALDLVQLLTSHQEDINLKLQNKKGQTVFHLLALTNLGPLTEQLLLSKASKDILDLRDNNGMTAAMFACITGKQFNRKEDTILNLLNKYVNASDNQGVTVLHRACLYCSHNLVKQLLIRGASVNARDDEGKSPLMYACNKGNIKVVQLLLQNGADVMAVDSSGFTVLQHAVKMGCLDIVSHLASIVNNTLVLEAMNQGHYDLTKFLIKSGGTADVNKATNDGMLPLVYASQMGLVEYVRLLLDHGADVNLADQKCQTPLLMASQYGQLGMVKLLLENGAVVNQTDHDNTSPLAKAAMHGHVDIVALLLDHQADIHIAVKGRVAPLQFACAQGHLDVVKKLVEAGAVVDSQCMEMALDFHREHIVQYISSQGQIF